MSEDSNFNAIFGGVVPTATISRDYGSFRSELDQTLSPSLIPQPIGLEITDISEGIIINADGTIGVTEIGIYMVEATIVFSHNAPLTADTGYVYLVKGGVDVVGSTRLLRLNVNINAFTLSLSYLVNITDPQAETLALYFTATSTDIQIEYSTFATIPNASSVICNVFQIA